MKASTRERRPERKQAKCREHGRDIETDYVSSMYYDEMDGPLTESEPFSIYLYLWQGSLMAIFPSPLPHRIVRARRPLSTDVYQMHTRILDPRKSTAKASLPVLCSHTPRA